MNTRAANAYMAALRDEGMDDRTPEQVVRNALPDDWELEDEGPVWLAAWVIVVLAALLLLGIGFAIGRFG